MLDRSDRYSMLLAYYGGLLTEHQREAAGLYFDENMSLTEIAEEFGISRQGVHDALKSAESALDGYEEKLALAEMLFARSSAIREIDGIIEEILNENAENKQLREKLSNVKKIIDNLEE